MANRSERDLNHGFDQFSTQRFDSDSRNIEGEAGDLSRVELHSLECRNQLLPRGKFLVLRSDPYTDRRETS